MTRPLSPRAELARLRIAIAREITFASPAAIRRISEILGEDLHRLAGADPEVLGELARQAHADLDELHAEGGAMLRSPMADA